MKRIIKQYYQEILILLAVAILVVRSVPKVLDHNLWIMTHWVLSYENGFVSRGFVGEILRHFKPFVMLNELYLIVSVIYFIFLALILTAVLGILVKEKNNRNLFLFILFFIVNPGTITMLAGDFGRFDLFMIIIALLCIVSIAVKKLEWCIPVLFILGILIHEAFVFMYAPLILAVLLFSALYGQKRIYGISVLIVSIITLTGSYAAVFLFGNASGIGYERFVSSVQLRAGFKIEERMINMEYFYSLKDHLDYLLTRLKDPAFSLNFIAALIILIPTFVFFWK